MWLNLLFASGILLVIVGAWFGVYYVLNPRLERPDGKARLTGSCGDTMEIRLRFSQGCVAAISHMTTGCLYSVNCLEAAANLAKGKTPEEALDIDPDSIQKAIGGLPKDHMHCATLAVATLQEAINDYMRKSTGKPSSRSRFTPFGIRYPRSRWARGGTSLNL
jgi:NifU-like protein involved in Fe-S cluster formation